MGEIGERTGSCTPPSNRTFDDLMSHEEKLAEFAPNLQCSYEILKPYIDLAESNNRVCPDYRSFLSIFGKLRTNSFTIYALENSKIVGAGQSICLGPSVFDHSCVPNALHCEVGKTLIIKAVGEIQSFDDVCVARML